MHAFDSNTFSALIPARGGSKGVPRKNLALLGGLPLIAHSIKAAQEVEDIRTVFVTTDDEEIAEVASEFGARIIVRPKSLALDRSPTISAVLHAVKTPVWDAENLVLLQPTSPLRTATHIREAIQMYLLNDRSALASVSPVRDNPLFIRTIGSDQRMTRIIAANSTVRRQDAPSYFRINGAVYIQAVEHLTEKTSFNDSMLAFQMDSESGLDIDTSIDLRIASELLTLRSRTDSLKRSSPEEGTRRS